MPLLYNFFSSCAGMIFKRLAKKNTKTKIKQTETEQEHIEFPDATSSLKYCHFKVNNQNRWLPCRTKKLSFIDL